MTEEKKKRVLLMGGMHFNVPRELHDHFEIVKHIEQGTSKIGQLPHVDYIFVITNWVDHGMVKAAKRAIDAPVVWLRKGWNAMSAELIRQKLLDPVALETPDEITVLRTPARRKRVIVVSVGNESFPEELTEVADVVDASSMKESNESLILGVLETKDNPPDLMIVLMDDPANRSSFKKYVEKGNGITVPYLVTSSRWEVMKKDLAIYGIGVNEDDPSKPRPKVKPDPNAFSRTCSKCGRGCSSDKDDLCVSCQKDPATAAPASTGLQPDELWRIYGKKMIECVRAALKPKERVKEKDLIELLCLEGGVGIPEGDLQTLLPELILRGVLENSAPGFWRLMSSETVEYEREDVLEPIFDPKPKKEKKTRSVKIDEDRLFEAIEKLRGLPMGPYSSRASLVVHMNSFKEFQKPPGMGYAGEWCQLVVSRAIDLKVVDVQQGKVFVDHDPAVVLTPVNPVGKEAAHGGV